ncbi:MAG: class I SAM-dependent methyltransferase [Bdellovibrionales bacterium]|jgi:16S rRNA (guanine1516-N2)-methyltransferase|nr:class I SAM-dependent methyltransferase [Bdellovibrionales bacterium]
MTEFDLIEVPLGQGTALGLVSRAMSKSSEGQKPIVVDFLSPKLLHRTKAGADGEAVVKAVGVKRTARAGVNVFDFTAGLGTDAFLLARAGFSVTAFERDARLFALLQDGLRRWKEVHGDRLDIRFVQGDARLVAQGKPHAVLLDPMFEGDAIASKSPPKKEMATLRRMLQTSSEAELGELMDTAVRLAQARVIVKRPNGAASLRPSADMQDRLFSVDPVHSIDGKTARFDIYSCR